MGAMGSYEREAEPRATDNLGLRSAGLSQNVGRKQWVASPTSLRRTSRNAFMHSEEDISWLGQFMPPPLSMRMACWLTPFIPERWSRGQHILLTVEMPRRFFTGSTSLASASQPC